MVVAMALSRSQHIEPRVFSNSDFDLELIFKTQDSSSNRQELKFKLLLIGPDLRCCTPMSLKRVGFSIQAVTNRAIFFLTPFVMAVRTCLTDCVRRFGSRVVVVCFDSN